MGARPSPSQEWMMGRTAGQIVAAREALGCLPSFADDVERLKFKSNSTDVGQVFVQRDTDQVWMWLGEIEDLDAGESWIEIKFVNK